MRLIKNKTELKPGDWVLIESGIKDRYFGKPGKVLRTGLHSVILEDDKGKPFPTERKVLASGTKEELDEAYQKAWLLSCRHIDEKKRLDLKHETEFGALIKEVFPSKPTYS